MVKLFGVLMAISIMLVLLACAPRAAPVATPTPAAPQVALPLPAPVAPVISAEETAWQKVVEAAKKEGTLTVYSSALVGDVGLNVVKGFKDRTGIGLEVVAGTGVMVERIKAEQRARTPIASVLESGSTEVHAAKRDGLLQPMGYLPSLADEALWYRNPQLDKERHGIALGPGLQTPYINTKLVNPGEEPKSWKDLLQSKWTGKIAISDPDIQPPPNRIYYYLTKYGGLDDSYFRALGKQVVFYPTNRHTAEAVARGEQAIALWFTSGIAGPFVLEGAPIKAIDMEEGVVSILAVGAGLVKSAPHPNAARVYINWMLSREGQTIYHKYRADASFRKDVLNFEPPATQVTPKKTIWSTPEDEIEVTQILRSKVLKKLMTEK